MKYNCVEKQKAFTLAETMITLVIIGVVAALTVPSLMHKKIEQEAVAKVTKIYGTLAQAVSKYQLDNACTEHIGKCDVGYNDLENIVKTLNIVNKCNPCTNTDWLPASSKDLNGTKTSSSAWATVTRNSKNAYLLADGTTLSFYKESDSNVHISFDINGKRTPNHVGKDIFLVSLGVRHKNNLDYRYPTLTALPGDDERAPGGLCMINEIGATCDIDTCTKNSCSPTAYVLKHKKLPPINW